MQRLHVDDTLLMIIDVQARLLPVMYDADTVERSCIALINAANILQIPIITTEQYPEKLGATVPSLTEALAEAKSATELFSKRQFSSCTVDVMAALLRHTTRRNILLCGIEAHVCVLQTVLDLRARKYNVFVPRNAISSRKSLDAEIAWQRMTQAGAIPATTESALFELLQTSDRAEFKPVQKLIK